MRDKTPQRLKLKIKVGWHLIYRLLGCGWIFSLQPWKLKKMDCNKKTTAFQEATKPFCWNLDDQTNSFHILPSLEMAEFFWDSAFIYWAICQHVSRLMYEWTPTGFGTFRKLRAPISQPSVQPSEWWYRMFFSVGIENIMSNSSLVHIRIRPQVCSINPNWRYHRFLNLMQIMLSSGGWFETSSTPAYSA